MLGQLVAKLRKSCRRRGVLGTVVHCTKRLVDPVLELLPTRRRERRLKEEQDRDFDTRYGVDTGGIVQLKQLQIAGNTWEYGVPYWAIDPGVFARLLRSLPIEPRDFTFVDFGSGKGRAVLMASEFPFRKIVGVEFSPELDRVARQNVGTFRSERRQCRDVELVCTDALDYPLPAGPGVYYFYNPFEREIMEGVAARVEQSFRDNPREIYVLYANPKHGDVWERTGVFRVVSRDSDFTIYRAGP